MDLVLLSVNCLIQFVTGEAISSIDRLKLRFFKCFIDRPSLHNLVNKNQFGAQLILSIFINFYMFRATMCPSSGETTVLMRHLVLVILTTQSYTQDNKYQVSH
jgi:hypothetical protein